MIIIEADAMTTTVLDALLQIAAALGYSLFDFCIVLARLQAPNMLTILLIAETLALGLTVFSKSTATRVYSLFEEEGQRKVAFSISRAIR